MTKQQLLAPTLEARLSLVVALMCSCITIALGLLLYFWYDHSFSNTFEDYVIDDKTEQYYLDRGIKDEWLLGVTSDSIDLVDAVFDEPVASRILERAQHQVESAKTYRENIDGKYMLYSIRVQLDEGERVYRYSAIKDIYKERLPMIASSLLAIVLVVFFLTRVVIRRISRRIDSVLATTANKLARITEYGLGDQIDTSDIRDENLLALVQSYNSAQEQLKQHSKHQEQMLQYISHELNTPLMIIASYAEAAREGLYPKGSLASSLEVIEDNVDRMGRKVFDLLNVARIESEHTDMPKQEVRIDTMLRSAVDEISGLYPGVSSVVSCPSRISLQGYPSACKTMFEGLALNAFKRAGGSVAITVEALGSSRVRISAYDDGPMISPEAQEALFDPFAYRQGDDSGVNLALIKRIVGIHGGTIAYEPSRIGALLAIVLPASKSTS